MASSDNEICHIVRDDDNNAVNYTLDPKKVTVTPPRALKKGKFSNVKYSGGSMYLESPLLHLPMGISSFEDDGKKSLFVSCRGHEDQDDVRLFVEALDALQERIVDQAASLKLLGEKSSREMLSDFLTPIVKTSDKYPPAFRVTLPQQTETDKDGNKVSKYTFSAFTKEDKKTVPCDIDNMELRGARAKIIFTVSNVWVVNNKNWGVSLKATQLLVKPSFDIKSIGMSCFQDDAMDDGEEDEGQGGYDQAASDHDD